MSRFVAALCAAAVAAPVMMGGARAAEVLFDRAGNPVAVLVPAAELAPPAMPMGMPFGFGPADAMMQAMLHDMQAMQQATFAPGVSGLPGLVPAGLAALPAGATQVVVSSFSNGRTSCSRTVTYRAEGHGAPLMQVSQTGDGCSALPAPGAAVPAALVPAAPALPEQAAPQQGPRLLHVDWPHRPAQAVPLRG